MAQPMEVVLDFLLLLLPSLVMGPLIVIAVCVCIDGCISCCCRREPRSETEDWDAAVVLAAQQARRALAAAPVVGVEQLGYFPYAGGVEAAGQRLVCGICLEELVRGAACSEVPACRHVFHWDCIGAWMKNGKSTCPLCRALIVPGSGRLSDAEDMV
jgi:hypothetical protein